MTSHVTLTITWTKNALRGHAATWNDSAVTDKLEEAIAHGGDPLHLPLREF